MAEYIILVADAGGAKLYTRAKKYSDLVNVDQIDHWRGRAHPGDLVTDQAGRTSPSTGSGMDTMAEGEKISDTEARRFAADLAERINQYNGAKRVVIAAPQFLGHLREKIDRIDYSSDKDLLDADLDQIAGEVDRLLES